MRRLRCSCGVFLLLGAVWLVPFGYAQNANSTPPVRAAADFPELQGDLPRPGRLSEVVLGQLPQVEMRVADPHHPDQNSVYRGWPLLEILKAGGLASGPANVRENVKVTIVAEGADGYRVVFALAEIDPEFTDRVVLLAEMKDGQPLSGTEGPYRLVVPGEKRPARWVRHVVSLLVRRN